MPLSTDRLRLRALEPDDLEDLFGLLSDDPAVGRVSWRQESRESTAQWLEQRIFTESSLGLSMWGVETLARGELVGLCGFLPRPKDPDVELGYVIRACDWGRGYATEAVRAAVGVVTGEGHRIYATIRPWNIASIVVAERAGLEPDGEVIDSRGPLIVYRSPPAGTGAAMPHRRLPPHSG